MRLFGTSEVIDNELVIGGVATSTLKEKYGTPLYVFDEAGIDEKINIFKNHFKSDIFNTNIIYAGKAFLCGYLVKQLKSHQLSLDVVSGGELFVAKHSGFDGKDIYFHGNAKTYEELEFAVRENVGTIVLDNLSEATILNNILSSLNKTQRVLLRVNPTIETDTHKYIQTSNDDSKFGMTFQEAFLFLEELHHLNHLDFKGFHCHIGSQIFDSESYFTEAKRMIEFYSDVQKEFNLKLDELNLGGGFGVYYTKGDQPLQLESFLNEYIHVLENYIREYDIDVETISIEPGRSLINDFGTILYNVSHIKPSSHFDFLLIDGGMNDNLRPSLYEAKYTAVIANKMNDSKNNDYRIAGKLCESGDVLIENIKLPKANVNDTLAIPSTGAYTESMASNYNKIPRGAVVFVKDGDTHLAVKRETYEDLMRNEVF